MQPYGKAFSVNIRKFRKQFGLTQKELAEAVGYSEKTVSKWELDGCIPSVETLFRIASLFHVGMDALFAGTDTVYYLGIDGGGTKTAVSLADHTGKTIREIVLDACNPFDVGLEQTKNILQTGICQICQGIPLSSVVLFAGIAGGVAGSYYEPLRSFLQEFHFARAEMDSDNMNIVAAGLGEGDGITVILGTGICSYAVRNGQCRRIAGWGYLFDEGGSGFNIARDALSRYFSACDGSGEPTSLSAAIEEKAGCAGGSLLSMLYEGMDREGKKTIASYADLVFREAEKGDAVSRAVLRRNMAEVARIIRAGYACFPEDGGQVPVILAGGLTEQPLLLPYLREALGDFPGIELRILAVKPVEGALKKAMSIWKKERKI